MDALRAGFATLSERNISPRIRLSQLTGVKAPRLLGLLVSVINDPAYPQRARRDAFSTRLHLRTIYPAETRAATLDSPVYSPPVSWVLGPTKSEEEEFRAHTLCLMAWSDKFCRIDNYKNKPDIAVRAVNDGMIPFLGKFTMSRLIYTDLRLSASRVMTSSDVSDC